METKFNGRTLRQMIDELKENRCMEITRILPIQNSYIVEYEVKNE